MEYKLLLGSQFLIAASGDVTQQWLPESPLVAIVVMKTNFTEITIKIIPTDTKKNVHPNILSNASVTLKDDEGGYFTISGFTIWKSQYEGLNVTAPGSIKFKYCQFESGFWKRLKIEIIKAYDDSKIPIID